MVGSPRASRLLGIRRRRCWQAAQAGGRRPQRDTAAAASDSALPCADRRSRDVAADRRAGSSETTIPDRNMDDWNSIG